MQAVMGSCASMEIKSNLKNNYFKIYNEARGVMINRSLVLKRKSTKCLGYLEMVMLLFILFAIMTVAVYFGVNRWLFYVLLIVDLFIVLIPVLRTIWNYKWKKANNFKNTILIDKDGITDKSFKGIKITIGWDKVRGIVVKKYSLTIITKTSIYFYFDAKEQDIILKECLKYINRSKIIR